MPRHPRIAATSNGLSDRVYSVLAERARSMPGPVYPLHVGDTWLEPLPQARAESQRAADHPRLHGYSPLQGEPALLAAIRARIAARHGTELDPECLQVMPGATGGLAMVIAALLEPGDELLLPSPFWPLIRGIAASRGCAAVEVPFYTRLGEAGFDPEAALERAITGRTAAIYVNSPHNPTGRVLQDDVVGAIARVAARHDLWVIADEAYEDLVYAGSPRPIWLREELAERTVATHTLSKSYALAGARVGYTHGPPSAMQAVRGVQAFNNYCAARPMQLAAARAIAEGDAWLADARRAYADAGRAAAATVGAPVPEAGTFLFFDAAPFFVPGEGLDGFLERCLAAGVLLTPGPACGRHYATWVRLCFTAIPPAELREALGRLEPLVAPSRSPAMAPGVVRVDGQAPPD
jgi:N-succinyldiaminopimelate aminotransferase